MTERNRPADFGVSCGRVLGGDIDWRKKAAGEQKVYPSLSVWRMKTRSLLVCLVSLRSSFSPATYLVWAVTGHFVQGTVENSNLDSNRD